MSNEKITKQVSVRGSSHRPCLTHTHTLTMHSLTLISEIWPGKRARNQETLAKYEPKRLHHSKMGEKEDKLLSGDMRERG